MYSLWDLNMVVVTQTSRFFHAANLVLQSWTGADAELLRSLLTLSGNMLWARSSFEAADQAEEQQMAYSGAFIGTMAGQAVDAMEGDHRQQATALLTRVERQLRANHDQLLCLLDQEFKQQGLEAATPGQLNRAVWRRMFPGYPYGCSTAELCQLIRAQLGGIEGAAIVVDDVDSADHLLSRA